MCDQWQDTWSVPVWALAVEDPSGTFSSVPRQCQRKSDCLQVKMSHQLGFTAFLPKPLVRLPFSLVSQ